MTDERDITRPEDPPSDVEGSPAGRPPSKVVLACVGVGVVLVLAFFWWSQQPAEMSLREYLDIKGGAWHFRDFLITGTVESTGRPLGIELAVGDKRMHYLTVKDGEKTAGIWYDPEEFPNPPKKGDVAQIEGHFDTCLSVGGMVGRATQQTTGIADKISTTNG